MVCNNTASTHTTIQFLQCMGSTFLISGIFGRPIMGSTHGPSLLMLWVFKKSGIPVAQSEGRVRTFSSVFNELLLFSPCRGRCFVQGCLLCGSSASMCAGAMKGNGLRSLRLQACCVPRTHIPTRTAIQFQGSTIVHDDKMLAPPIEPPSSCY
jgi:hypothetical protein